MSCVLKRKASWATVAVLSLLAVGHAVTSDAQTVDQRADYHVSQRWKLAGTGESGFILLSEKEHRLYIPRSTRITVIDTDNGSQVGEVQGLTDARDVALDPNGKLGYVCDGITGTVRSFDRSTFQLVASVQVEGTLEALVFEPKTFRLLAFDTHNKVVAVINPADLRIIARLTLPGRPATALADGAGSVFVNLSSSSQLARIDARTIKLQQVTSLSPCVGPSGMAIDLVHAYVLSVCENKKMVVVDSRTGGLLATVPVGEGARTVEVDAKDDSIFSANGEGTLTVIKRDAAGKYSPSETVKTEPGARTVAFDPDHQQLYLLSAKFGQRTEPTSEELQFRPTPVPDSSVVLVIRP